MGKIIGPSILVVAALLVGGTGGYFVHKHQAATPQAVVTNSEVEKTQQVDTPRAADKTSGFNMTPPGMADELQSLPAGEDTGWRYVNYLILMRNNEIAMARQAQEKATQPEVRQEAQKQIDINQELVSKLYGLMRAAGMSH
jgi:uncharacterized protein (DUF305 family)